MNEKIKKFVADNPNLLAEWNWDKNGVLGFDPYKITYGSAQKVWWKCNCGNEWMANLNHRSRGRGCPICSQRSRQQTRNINMIQRRGSLAEASPELASEWHPTKNENITANDVLPNSTKRYWWLCKKGHEYNEAVHTRFGGSGCPICSGHKVLVGYNDLATVNPILASEWHPTKNVDLKATGVTAKTARKVWWICRENHEYEAQISNRSNGNGCPYCIGKKVLIGYNDLTTTSPNIAKEWHPTKNGDLKPTMFTKHSNKKMWWQCKKGHEWRATINHRTGGNRCPDCFGEMKTSFPEQTIYFYFKTVTEAYNRYKLDGRTEIDVYLPKYKIGIEYDGDYYHEGKKSIEREKRKEEKLKEQGILLIRVKEVNKLPSTDAYEHTIYTKPRSTYEELDKTIRNIFNYINKLASLSLKADISVERDASKIYEQYIEYEKQNSLATVNPSIANEWHPTKNGTLLPGQVSFGSNKIVWWLCKNGHEWKAMVNTRSKGVGCPYCSKRKKK